MKIIVGLGNPGKEYANTRHNAGFDVLEKVSDKLNIPINQEKFKAKIGQGNYKGEKILLVQPQTYMNLSGESIIQIVQFYKCDLDDIVVVFDDMDTEVGHIRLRYKGSAGGQKGMKSIISLLGSENIARIRVGIGKDPRIPVVDYVLGKVRKEDRENYEKALDAASDAAIYSIDHSFEDTMSSFNKK